MFYLDGTSSSVQAFDCEICKHSHIYGQARVVTVTDQLIR